MKTEDEEEALGHIAMLQGATGLLLALVADMTDDPRAMLDAMRTKLLAEIDAATLQVPDGADPARVRRAARRAAEHLFAGLLPPEAKN